MATEKRMIDANALIDWLTKHNGFRGNCEDCTDIDCVDCIIENAIKNAPTVDAVEVVRCKDCVHYDGEGCLLTYGEFEPNSMDFCSYGERRNDG